MSSHLFLVILLMLAITLHLNLNLLSYVLIVLNLLRARISQVVDLSGNLGHTTLEVLCKVRPLLPFLIQHRLVLQVQVVILFKDRGAEKF